MKPETNINRRRELFPTLACGIHLLSHSLGPVPQTARDSMLAYYGAWEHHTSEDAWATSWWEMSQQVGDSIAKILGGDAGSVQTQPNASIALSSVLSCFDFTSTKRNKIVASALDFPSMRYILDAQTPMGARVETVASDDGVAIPTERILDAIDDATALVALSHVSFRSSYRVEVEPIVEKARKHGALVLLDVYQSAGAMELKARDWNIDFMIGGTIKWLCGGPACGYLYVRPDLQRHLQPRLTGWVAHTAPIRALLLLVGLVSLCGMPFSVLMPIFADRILHAGATGLGGPSRIPALGAERAKPKRAILRSPSATVIVQVACSAPRSSTMSCRPGFKGRASPMSSTASGAPSRLTLASDAATPSRTTTTLGILVFNTAPSVAASAWACFWMAIPLPDASSNVTSW